MEHYVDYGHLHGNFYVSQEDQTHRIAFMTANNVQAHQLLLNIEETRQVDYDFPWETMQILPSMANEQYVTLGLQGTGRPFSNARQTPLASSRDHLLS